MSNAEREHFETCRKMLQVAVQKVPQHTPHAFFYATVLMTLSAVLGDEFCRREFEGHMERLRSFDVDEMIHALTGN